MNRLLNLFLSLSILFSLIVPAGFSSPPAEASPALHTNLPIFQSSSNLPIFQSSNLPTSLPATPRTREITLITGDKVVVQTGESGKAAGYAVKPVDPRKAGQHFSILKIQGDTYVLPRGIDLKLFDRELFNVDRLLRYDYDREQDLPVMVDVRPSVSVPGSVSVSSARDVSARLQSFSSSIREMSKARSGERARSTLAARLQRRSLPSSFKSLSTDSSIEKVWLDKKIKVDLSQSVPQIGAPGLWAGGLTGAGKIIAILDTGIDATHPALDDLDDNPSTSDPKVLRQVNFSDDPGVADLQGHGTHVAGIAAGTRGASLNWTWHSGSGVNLKNSLQRSFNLSSVSSATLTFRTRYNIETSFDSAKVQVSTNNGATWTTLDTFSGDSNAFAAKSYSLDSYRATSTFIRFYYETDFSFDWGGWYLDDIAIPQLGFLDNMESGNTGWTVSNAGASSPSWSIVSLTSKGVAPGAWLWNVKVLNQLGEGLESWAIQGIDYARLGPDGIAGTGDEAHIISMSLGGTPTDGTDPLSRAVDRAVDDGLVVIIAAGNSGPSYSTTDSPGAARKAITIGAVDKSDVLASFSGRGPTTDLRVKPDLLAPGVSISSAVPGGGYGTKSGTSMSTPHVAGAAALLLQAAATSGWFAKPAGWDDSRYVRNVLINTANDLGLNVYQQGAGRLDVASAAYSAILIDESNKSLGRLIVPASVSYTIVNRATSAMTLNLSAELREMLSGADWSSKIWFTPSSLTIPPLSAASVAMTVNVSGLPSDTVFSGKVTASSGGKVWRAIFGFYTLKMVTLHKMPRDAGGSVNGDPFIIFSDASPPLVQPGYFDSTGNAVVYLPSGTYQVFTDGTASGPDSYVAVIRQNQVVSSDATIHLDEAAAVPVALDPNKAGQKLAELLSHIEYDGTNLDSSFTNLTYYPTATWTYYMSTTTWKSWSAYAYYASASFNASDPNLLNAPEWHRLLYSRPTTSATTTYIVDYSKLAKRVTQYRTANISGVRASRWDFVYDPVARFNNTFIWDITAPQSRDEWLSPSPAYYQLGGYQGPLSPESSASQYWRYDTWYPLEYTTGAGVASPALSYSLGLNPLRPGFTSFSASGTSTTGAWQLNGNLMADASRSVFDSSVSPDGKSPGHIDIWKDGTQESSFDTGYSYFVTRNFGLPWPRYRVKVTATSPFLLSTKSETEWSFQTDPAADRSPPTVQITSIWDGAPTPADLSNRLPAGDITMRVVFTDDSPLSTASIPWLKWSASDGASWNDSALAEVASKTYQFTMTGVASGSYLSFWTKAVDSAGNSTEFKVIRGLAVSGVSWTMPFTGSLSTATSTYTDAFIYGQAFDALAGLDSYDIQQPALSTSPYIDLYAAISAGSFSRDIRPVTDPATTSFNISTVGLQGTTTLAWNATSVPSNYSYIFLQDTASSAIVDMRASSSYSYTSNLNETRSFSLFLKSNSTPALQIISPGPAEIIKDTATVAALVSEPDSISPYNDRIASVSLWYASSPYTTWFSVGSPTLTSGSSASGVWSASLNTAVLGDGSSYKIKAVAADSLGGTKEVISASAFSVDNNPPLAPVLLSPADALRARVTTPAFIWASAPDVSGLKFDLQVATGPSFASLLVDRPGLTATSYTLASNASLPTGPADIVYYWRVRQVEAAGALRVGSYATRSYILDTTVGAPSLTLPVSSAEVSTSTPTLIWQAVSDSSLPVTYEIGIDNDAGFTSNERRIAVSTTTYTISAGLALGAGTWYWAVRAIDGVGNAGSFSAIRSFTINIPAATPTPAPAPVSGAAGGAAGPLPEVTPAPVPVATPQPAPTPAPAATPLPVATPAPIPALAPVSQGIPVNPSTGILSAPASVQTLDGKAFVHLPAGTQAVIPLVGLVSSINITPRSSPPAPVPAAKAITSLVYTFEPAGAVFYPPIDMKLSYNPALLPAGVPETSLKVARFSGGVWAELDSTVDTIAKTVTARVSGFSEFTVLAPAAAPTPTPTPSPPRTPRPRPTPAPEAGPEPAPSPSPLPTASPTPPLIAAPLLTPSPAPQPSTLDPGLSAPNSPSPQPSPSAPDTSQILLIVAAALMAALILVFISLRKKT